ncbi:MAG: sigma-70 family RNA polymerase sigma factor [bacterium]|nr:sigma-70 family RNA polymerase sigma factor [bacterium]
MGESIDARRERMSTNNQPRIPDHLRELIARVCGGDPAMFEDFVKKYGDQLLARTRKMITPDVRALTETQGIVDSVLMQAPELLAQFRYGDEEALLRFLTRVAANKVSAWRAHLQAVKRGGGNQSPNGSVASRLIAHQADDGQSPSDALSDAENRERVLAAIARLKDDHRAVIALRHLEGLPLKTVGERLGISEDAARMRVCRAELALQRILHDGADVNR